MNDLNIMNDGEGQKQATYVPSSEQTRLLTPIHSIRAKCLDCSNGSRTEVRLCELTDCALWPYRMGRRPKRNYQLQ